MAAQIFQLGGVNTSLGMDLPFKNFTGSDIAAGLCVKIDTGNIGSNVLPQGVIITSDSTLVIGITQTIIPAGKLGLVRLGGIAVATCSAAITAGVQVMSDSAGKVLTQTAGLTQVGIALSTTSATGESCMVLIALAKNA